MAQERRVLLANGQYITIVQTTGTSSGDVMSQSAVTAALSTKSDVGHTHNASAITGGTFGTSRIADKSITLEKLADNVPISTTLYEIVKVSGLTTNGVAAVGAEVLIGGVVHRFDEQGVVSAQIPYGQVYKVAANISLWTSNYSNTFTAGIPVREITLTYVLNDGVYIESSDGLIYTTNNWDSNKIPNSIVLLGNGVKFRVALTESGMDMNNTCSIGLDRYMTGTTSSATALSDYDGAGNTANILKAIPSTSYAAGYCNAFTFPDGKTKGYLPSFGQLDLVYQNRAAVKAALKACGGTALYDGSFYWSSTYYGRSSNCDICWLLDLFGRAAKHYQLNLGYGVRPFAAYP